MGEMMNDNMPIGTVLSIRSCGYDEYWLQDRIAENPAALQLGDLEILSRERRQSAGGRLDMLLKDPADDSMYEVELMLGDTDETHIIRTIEYWDNEKRKWPKRQHSAVLVAESITRRFYNVIQLLSHAIPVIAVQVNIVEADGKRMLHFSKILDTYEEPEDEEGPTNESYDEEYWRKKASWTVDAAKALRDIVAPVFDRVELKYVKNYIAISVAGYNYFWLHKRTGEKSLIGYWFKKGLLRPEAMKLFDDAGVPYLQKYTSSLMILADQQTIQNNAAAFREAAKLVKKSDE
jgi:hypothetical protein